MNITIIGTGKIAEEVIGALSSEAPEIGMTSIFAHSQHSVDKAKELSKRYGIDKVYSDYDDLLLHDDADFVYIALVNAAHYEYAKQALEAGRNVIVEKPFTASYEEAAELARIAMENNLYLFEAVTTLHQPNFKLAKRLIADIAPIRIIQCNYSQYSSRYDRYLRGDVAPAFNPEMGGGALNDLNIYNVNAVVGLIGKPLSTHYFPNRGFNGVDTSGVLLMNYDGAVAECTAAKDSASASFIIIQGEKGTISIPTAPNEVGCLDFTADGIQNHYQRNIYKSRLVHEFKDFEDIWKRQDKEQMSLYLSISLDVIQTISNVG